MEGGKSRLERARKTARRRRGCAGARRQRMDALQYRRYSAAVLFTEERRKKAARVSLGSLRKPETIICFCLISQIESYKYLYVSLIAIIIK